jgi:hypothetical protein
MYYWQIFFCVATYHTLYLILMHLNITSINHSWHYHYETTPSKMIQKCVCSLYTKHKALAIQQKVSRLGNFTEQHKQPPAVRSPATWERKLYDR